MKHAVRRSNRAGFTLIEILVSLVLLSVLVAAVFPVVTQQVGGADPARVASDLASVRTGIETFTLNVKGQYPGRLQDLAEQIDAADKDFKAVNYKHSTRWNGPYVDANLATDGSFQTGFDAKVLNTIVWFDAVANAPAEANTTAPTFAAVELTGLTGTDFDKVNELIDGAGETSTKTGGKLRQVTVGTDVRTFYLAAPVAK